MFRRHVGALAIGQEADAARPVADFYRLHNFSLGQVDDVDAVGLLAADVKPSVIGAEHRVLGIFAAHLDLSYDLAARRIDQHHLIVFLNGGRQQLGIARQIDAFGRFSQRRAREQCAGRCIDGQHRVGGLVTQVKPLAVG